MTDGHFMESGDVTVERGSTNKVKEFAVGNVVCCLGEGTFAGEGVNVIVLQKIMVECRTVFR